MNRSLNREAFTLLELLVALGITAMLAALLLAITTNTLTIWDRSVSALGMENEAQLIISRIVIDLESLVLPIDGRAWAEIESTGSETTSGGFFSNLASTSGAQSDPSTIREVAYKLSEATTPSRLYRWEGTAEEALGSGYQYAAPASVTDNEFLLNESLAEWRLSFWRTPAEEIDLAVSAEIPRLVRLEFSLISADGVARLEAVEKGFSNEVEADIREQSTRRFTRWIELKGVAR